MKSTQINYICTCTFKPIIYIYKINKTNEYLHVHFFKSILYLYKINEQNIFACALLNR